jgi:hypothetical protein
MKTYITITIITFLLTILSFSSKDSISESQSISKSNYKDSLNLIKLNHDSLLLDVQKDIDSFKMFADSVLEVSIKYDKQLDKILSVKQAEYIDTSQIVIDTIANNVKKKKKTWIKRTIDKIKN